MSLEFNPIITYMQFIEQNLDYVEEIKAEVEYWEKIYKKRVYDHNWPNSIRSLIFDLKTEIRKQIEECLYYINRIKEIKENAAISCSQPEQNEENVGSKGRETGDPVADVAEIEQQDMGFTPEENDNNRSEDL